MPDQPGTGPQGPEPGLTQPDQPVTIITQVRQMWEQMRAQKTADLLQNSSDHLKRTHQIHLQILNLLVEEGLEKYFKAQG